MTGTQAPDPDGGEDAAEARRRSARFAASVLPHLDAAYNLARFLTRSADAAEEILQEAMLRAFRAVEDFRGEDARPWVLAIVRNCAATWTRVRRSAPDTVPLVADAAAYALEAGPDGVATTDSLWSTSTEHTPEAALARKDEIAAIRTTIERLPEPFRAVLVLRELEELPYREIAAVLGVPVGTVMSRLSRAREMFAAAWKRQFGDDAAIAATDGEHR